MKGYTGKVLLINLTSGIIKERSISDEVYESYLSGIGLGAYFLYKLIPPGADPLGPDNVLGFVSGLLTGTGSLLTGRWLAVCKSPLTGGWGDANCGGNFSPAIKRCGYDGIFFSGISPKPVYLFADHEEVQLRDAVHVWGLDAVESEIVLQSENETTSGKKPAVAVIGQAGENLSLIAGICNDGGRIAARSGCGAVMGSKKLKAVVLAGSKPINCANPAVVKAISKEYRAKVQKNKLPLMIKGETLLLASKAMSLMKYNFAIDGMSATVPLYKKWGTIVNNQIGIVSGDSPVKNWGGSVKDYNYLHYKNISADRIIKREVKKYSCYSCVLACGGICDIKDIAHGAFTKSHKPEYETCCAFAGLLQNKDLDSIFYLNAILNRAGMDSISAGNTVAFAIECFEHGILTSEDTGGLILHWGDSTAIVELVNKMIAREGIGDLLADGVKRASQNIGRNSLQYAMHAGGQELGLHDPRFDPMMGLHFSVDPTPGRHTIGSAYYYNLMHLWKAVSWAPRVTRYEKKDEFIPSDVEALKAVALASFKQLIDGSGGCLFAALTGIQHWRLFDWLNAATGWQKTPDEYMKIGRRVQTLRQLFNIREKVNPLSNRMPDRVTGNPPLSHGPIKGKRVHVNEMMRLYWKSFGWNETTGVPLESTVNDLGLDFGNITKRNKSNR